MVVIPTDKTNAFRTVELTKYIEWLKNHLSKSATVTSKENLANIFDSANSLLQDIKPLIDEQEFNFLSEKSTQGPCQLQNF